MDSDQERRADMRAASSPTGIGAAFEQTVSSPGEDGHRFRLCASDGHQSAPIVVGLSRTESVTFAEIPASALERVVERIAGSFPAETRLKDLAGAEISLRAGDFRTRDFEPAETSLG